MNAISVNELEFLEGDGEMARLIRTKNWAHTPLGPIEHWSVSLRMCLNIMLNTHSPMLLIWGDDLICFYNDAFKPSLGSDKKHPINLGLPAKEFWPEIWDEMGPHLISIKNGGKPTWNTNQLLAIHRNGTVDEAYWSYGFSPVKDLNNVVVGIITIITETTTAYKAKKALIESEAHFRKIAEGNSMMIAMVNKTKNAVYFNKAWSDFSGKTTQELQNFGWIELVHPLQKDDALRDYLKHIELNRNWESELKMLDKNGNYRWIATYFMPKLADDQSFDSAVSSSLDIHDKKLFSEELERKVELRTQELRDTNLELEKSNDELQSFAYISSHDLQEPLRKIRTFASQIVLKDFDNLSEKSKLKLHRLDASAERMQTLIDDLLEYSRTNHNDRTLEKLEFEYLFNEVKNELEEELAFVDATVTLIASTEVVVIPFQFKQVLYNLISNSIKFRHADKKLIINFSATNIDGASINNGKINPELTYTKITITDNGIGFNQDWSEKIFDVFKRLHSRKDFDGTGIGLSIVKKIITNHKGHIQAKSADNEGAEFTIYLPYTI